MFDAKRLLDEFLGSGAGGGQQRHHVLARQLRRDLDAAILGRAAPWREARTRFEARKLARMQTGEKPVAAPTERAPEPAFHAARPVRSSKITRPSE